MIARMKTFAKFIIFGMSLIMISCDREPELEAGYPTERQMTDRKGRTLDVVITGRSEEKVAFRRKSDGKTYDYPIAQLAAKDAAFVRTLPVTKYAVEPVKREVPRYIKHREKEIAELERKLTRLSRELEAPGTVPTRGRAIVRESTQAKQRIHELKTEIEEFQAQNRKN